MRLGAVALVIISVLGCEFGMSPDTDAASNEEIAAQLNDYRPLLADFAAATTVATSPAADSDVSDGLGGSAVSAPWNDAQLDAQPEWAAVFLNDPNDRSTVRTPSEVFAAYDGNGDGIAYVPGETGSSDYIKDYYAPGDQLRFVLEDVGSGFYKVEVYSYPRSNFLVRYSYEEYYVIANDTGWTYHERANADTAGSYAVLETHYADGSVGRRTLEDEHPGGDGAFYPAFAFSPLINTTSRTVSGPVVGEAPIFSGLEATVSDYVYREPSTPAASASTGQYSSYVTETVIGEAGSKVDSEQFYTEPDGTSASAVTYAVQGKRGKWATKIRSVSRLERDGDAGTQTTRTLSTTGNIDSIWESGVTETSVSKTNTGLTQYESVYAQWWEDITDGDVGEPAYRSTLVLTQTSVGSESFSGYKVYRWDGDFMVDRVELTHNGDGSYTLTRTYAGEPTLGASALGARNTIGELRITLSSGDGSMPTMSLDHNGGTLELSYEQGALIGSYTKAGRRTDVAIGPEGVGVGDEFFRGSDL